VERAFMIFSEVAETHRTVVIMDLCKHPFEEFTDGMGKCTWI
jgi:hypothetical protein